MCPDHPQYSMEMFCNTCNKKVCYNCVFVSHRDKPHNVISKKDVEGHIDTTTKRIQQRIQNLKGMLHAFCENICKFEKREHAAGFDLIKTQCDVWESLLKRHEKDILIALAERKEYMRGKVHIMKDTVQESEKSVKQIQDAISKVTEDKEKLPQLELLCKWREKLVELKAKVQKGCHEIENVQFLFRPLSRSGVFAELRFSNVVGAVALSKKYALVVKDERKGGLKITMSCVAFDTQRSVWQRQLDVFGCDKPVIMPAHIFSTGVQAIVLVGIGRTLTHIHNERDNEECSISKVITSVIGNIPEGDYITAITAITSGNRDVALFIAYNSSTTLLRFNSALKYERDIDCSSVVHSIYSVASVDNDIAIIDSVCEEIVLLKVKGDDVMMWGKLNVTENSVQIPKMIQWDGNFWAVLFVSKEDMGQLVEWGTVNYLKDSAKFSSSGKGICKPRTTAVSISFILDLTVVCFSDGTVTVFSTVNR
ncbi:hypothetical protein HOLleu_07885 [Holothuria leucospilota]|uniref:B box-type domain-containing protein n=1 Tax=Holothuria leucospilota TaxID=206669 RepID=A0A9Q1CI88_HOLLE|nr:hypothetical protein HOLleu_07885 [Holothuria leucospilota]